MLGLGSNQDLVYDHSSKIFIGVRFILLGFDPTDEDKVRWRLIDGGGVEVRQCGPDCTHVIVDNLVYDDPSCIAARSHGKILVTGLWVDHSFDVGMPVDPNSIMYRPLRDLNGIPGAQSLVVCLTGYQRQDRDDIMIMVGLMGANFSKPLISNKVTHLICYKFEGEKYELAKKLKKIKLVNHHWLEDCLREWEFLPEENYDKSGYELEMMEAEAKDSEDESEDNAKKQCGDKIVNASPSRFQIETYPHKSITAKQQVVCDLPDSTAFKDLSNVNSITNIVPTAKNGLTSDQVSFMHEINHKHPEVLGPLYTNIDIDISHNVAPKPYDSALSHAKVETEVASSSGSFKKRSPPNAKFSGTGYFNKTPRKTLAEKYPGEKGCNSSSFTAPLDISSAKLQLEEETDSPSVKTPAKGIDLCVELGSSGKLQEEIKKDIFCGSSGSLKTSNDSRTFNLKGQLAADIAEGMESTSLVYGSLVKNDHISPGHSGHFSEEHLALDYARGSPNISGKTLSCFSSKSVAYGLPASGIVVAEIQQDRNVAKVVQTSSTGVENGGLTTEACIEDVEINTSLQASGRTGEAQMEMCKTEVPSLGTKKLKSMTSSSPAKSSVLKGRNVESHSKPHSKKVTSKKILDSRSSVGKGGASNKKGSLYLKTALENDSVSALLFGEVTADDQSVFHVGKIKIASPESKTEFESKTIEMDDETKGREDKEDNDNVVSDEGKSGGVERIHSTNVTAEEKSKDAQDTTKNTDGWVMGMQDNVTGESNYMENAASVVASKPTKCSPSKAKNTVFAGKRKIKPVEAAACEDAQIEIKNKEDTKDKQILVKPGKTKKKMSAKESENSVSTVNRKMKPMEVAADEEYKIESNNKMELKDKRISVTAGKTKKKIAVKESENSVSPVKRKMKSMKAAADEEAKIEISNETEAKDKSILVEAGKTKRKMAVKESENSTWQGEKENRPISSTGQNVTHGKFGVEKPATKCNKMSEKMDLDSVHMEQVSKVKTETALFILSGHKLQRKEFQQVIKRLKGRVCRDSHQWSYQATHFIAPDPIRRTEKFFAAAASGRWILKTDYLTSSNQAGRFLKEEPYEWHMHGLSEDGAINLEAPRRWRLLRERTGHGAFYGMRIIIYGECIAPSLDTLKRVVKAGDGTIVATSPPYTRCLGPGIDFAIVSAGMPYVDMWVQEFLKHAIPCVLADYLVEYVCKPGFSLERHVLYNTRAWAEKSLENLTNRLEECVEDSRPQEDNNDSCDLPCEVCGSRDRGDVMLICGSESGSAGCGVGIHIDCCDPPLDDVPEEDWFCLKCR